MTKIRYSDNIAHKLTYIVILNLNGSALSTRRFRTVSKNATPERWSPSICLCALHMISACTIFQPTVLSAKYRGRKNAR